MTSAPTTIDLSRLPAPLAIEALNPAALETAFITRFVENWDEERERDPTLPAFTIAGLQANPAAILKRVFSYLRLLDRQRVNDAVHAVLAPTAAGADLDNIAAAANVQRLVVVPANPATNTPAVLESDAALLRRYLLSFDRPSAGSAGRFLFEAWTAWPQMGDVAVVGRAVHGRRGDVDIVVSGPGGREPTPAELAAVRAAVTTPTVAPEAVAVNVLAATRRLYAASFVAEIPPGPDAILVAGEAAARVRAAATVRTTIGGEVPAGLLGGAAYGDGTTVLKARDISQVAIDPDPYTVPVCTGIVVTPEVRA